MSSVDYHYQRLRHPIFISCGGFLIVLYTFNYLLPDCASILGLVTANTLITNTYVWNLVTSCFYETNIVKLIIDLILLFVTMKSFRITNIEQFSLYFVFSILACTIGASG